MGLSITRLDSEESISFGLKDHKADYEVDPHIIEVLGLFSFGS